MTAQVATDRQMQAAARLLEAQDSGLPCPPVRDLIGSSDLEAAYEVQRILGRERVARGARVVGRKVGLTSLAVQQQLGVDQPDLGTLFDDMRLYTGDVVSVHRLLQPRIEAEVAFILEEDLRHPPFDHETVSEAVAYCAAALEIVDSRIAGWDITIADTVADNGSSGLFVLNRDRLRLDEFTPRDCTMRMLRDGEVVSTGNGAACLGDPVAALLWLAATAHRMGQPLLAGDVVLSGALGPMVPVLVGEHYVAQISGLGDVEVTFADGSNPNPGRKRHR